MIAKIKKFFGWYFSTSTVVGIPVLFFILLQAMQIFFFTASCSVAGWKCEHSFGVAQAMTGIEAILADNPDAEIRSKKR